MTTSQNNYTFEPVTFSDGASMNGAGVEEEDNLRDIHLDPPAFFLKNTLVEIRILNKVPYLYYTRNGIHMKLDIENGDVMKKLGLPEGQINLIKKYTQLTQTQIVPEEYKDEYCLLFSGKVIFHSKDIAEIEKYKKNHQYLGFTQYYPEGILV